MREVNVLAAWALLATDAAEEAAAKRAELPARSLAALVLLANRPGSSADWLFRRLGLTQSGAARLVDRLAAAGLLRREPRPGQREIGLHVTTAGTERLEMALRARADAVRALAAPLAPAERRQFAALADKALRGGTRQLDESEIACRLCDWAACTPACPVEVSADPPDARSRRTAAGAAARRGR